MYIAKAYLDRQLMNVEVYEDYEHFMSDLTCGDCELYGHIPEERLQATDFGHPQIVSGCSDKLGFCSDFEYRYDTGITVYCGRILTAEDMARSCRQAG